MAAGFVHPKALELIELIYQAAADPSTWQAFLSEFRACMGGCAAAIQLEYPTTDRPGLSFSAGWDSDFHPEYIARFHSPWYDALQHQPVGKVVAGESLVSRDTVERSDYYWRVLRPQRIAAGPNFMLVLATKDGRVDAGAGCIRREDSEVLNDEHMALFETLAPHLVRARQLHVALTDTDSAREALIAAVNRLHLGVILLDRLGRPVYANRSAGQHLGFELDGFARSDRARVRLANFCKVVELRAGGPLISHAGGGLMVPHPFHGHDLTILISPVQKGAEETGLLDSNVTTVLFLGDPHNEFESVQGLLQELYRLTPAESRLAFLLAADFSLEEAAAQLGIKLGTARTRLKHIFEKTGTNRQASLMHLLLRSPAMLRPEH